MQRMKASGYIRKRLQPQLTEWWLSVTPPGDSWWGSPTERVNFEFPLIQRLNDNLVVSAGGAPVVSSRASRVDTRLAVLWSRIGYRDFCLDIDVAGLEGMWFVNFECVSESYQLSESIADALLGVLQRDGALATIYSRYDEPLDSDSLAGLDGAPYESHNVSVTMPGNVAPAAAA